MISKRLENLEAELKQVETRIENVKGEIVSEAHVLSRVEQNYGIEIKEGWKQVEVMEQELSYLESLLSDLEDEFHSLEQLLEYKDRFDESGI